MKILNNLDSLDNIQDGNTRKLITKTNSSGTGNAVTSVSVSGDTITYTKGTTFVLPDNLPTKISDLTNDSNFHGIYSGISEPDTSLGKDGDIYIQIES